MKKVLSLVLVIAMVLSSMSFAFAGTFTDVTGDYEKAIETLKGLGIVDGYEDGSFKPEKTITRAEMAKLMVITLGYGDLVAGSKSNFADTQGHWADPYIALAAGKGIVIGTGDGKFTPDRTVSYDEAITMVVRALGYTDSCNELKGTWPTNYKVKAAELKLTKDVKLATTGADRGGVAQLIFNALSSALVTVDTDGNVTQLFDTYTDGGKSYTVIRPLLSRLATKENISEVQAKHLDKDNKAYLGDIVDLAPYMYQDIDVYVNDDDEVVYVSKVNSDVLVGEFRRTADTSGNPVEDDKVNVRIDGKNKAYELLNPAKTPVFYNGVEVELTEVQMENKTVSASVVNLNTAAATFVLNDADKIVGIVANKFTDAKRVANEYNGRTKFEGFALPLNDDDEVDYDKLTVTGAVDSLEDVKVDDVLVLFAGAGERVTTADTEKLVIQVVRDTVEGKITKTNSDGQFYIDGKFYSASEFKKYTFTVGEEGTYFLDHKGKLVDFEETDSNEPKDYAVVTDLKDGYYATRIIADAEITVVTAKGEEVTYKFDDKAKVDSDYVFNNRGVDKTIVDANEDLEINDVLNKNDVIKYSLNSKGKISKITIVKNVAASNPTAVNTDITGKSYVFASNVVVFNLDGTDVEVVNVGKLGDKVDIITSKENKNGEIEMIFVKGLGASDTYAYLVDEGTMWNDNDQRVQTLTAYVNGVEVFYETNLVYGEDTFITDVDNNTIVKLELDGDIVTGVTTTYAATTPSALVTGNITKVSGERIQVGSVWYTLADDVSVYVLDDKDDTFDSVGDASSVYYDAKVAGFTFDADNKADNIIEILFIYE